MMYQPIAFSKESSFSYWLPVNWNYNLNASSINIYRTELKLIKVFGGVIDWYLGFLFSLCFTIYSMLSDQISDKSITGTVWLSNNQSGPLAAMSFAFY